MRGMTFRVPGSQPLYAALLLAAGGWGHCPVTVLAGTFTGWVQRHVDWNASSLGAIVLRRACGVLVILAGLYLPYAAR
jgi:cytochrome c-type biogenesis protein